MTSIRCHQIEAQIRLFIPSVIITLLIVMADSVREIRGSRLFELMERLGEML